MATGASRAPPSPGAPPVEALVEHADAASARRVERQRRRTRIGLKGSADARTIDGRHAESAGVPMSDATDEEGRGAFTALDWIGTVLAAAAAAALFFFPVVGARFADMFKDFGGRLPALTLLAISTWFPVALGVVVIIATLSGGALVSLPIGTRRALVVAAFALGVLAVVLCWVGVYLPIFELSGNIKGD